MVATHLYFSRNSPTGDMKQVSNWLQSVLLDCESASEEDGDAASNIQCHLVVDNAKSHGSRCHTSLQHTRRKTRRTKSDDGIWHRRIDRTIRQVLPSLPWNGANTKRGVSPTVKITDMTVANSISLHHQMVRRIFSMDQCR